MTHKMPACEDFVIATIRTIRKVRPTQQTPGTAPGVEIRRIWATVRKSYNETDFRAALNILLEDGRLTGIFHHDGHVDRLEAVPEDWTLSAGVYKRVGDYVTSAVLYVTADGLAEKVLKVTERRKREQAKILAKLEPHQNQK